MSSLRALWARVGDGWRIGVGIALLSYLSQATSVWRATGRGERWSLLVLPGGQWPLYLIGAVVPILWGLRATRGWRMGWWGLTTAYLILLAADQLVFALFGEHLSLSQTEGRLSDLLPTLPALLGSAVAAADATVLTTLVGITAFSIWWFLRSWHPRAQAPRPRTRSQLVALGSLALGLLALRGPAARASMLEPFQGHPLAELLKSEGGEGGGRPALTRAELEEPIAPSAEPPTDSALVRAARQLAAEEGRRNVLLLVLESVGSLQLLPGGRPDSTLTPMLASLLQDAIVFPTIYSGYPATTRAHVPMMTGGRTITWGSVSEELAANYTAPTLPSALEGAGYRTALYAAPDLRFGSLRTFYKTMPWDTLVHYEDGTGSLTAQQEIHSWGVNEDAVRPMAMAWIDQEPTRPFFLAFHTIATHHPYGSWGESSSTREEDVDRYRRSLAYTDAVLGRLLADLRARGLLEQTLIVITGDHGEAFADLHQGNWVHRGAIYEENIRNFLIFAAPGSGIGTVRSERIGTHGDLLPTTESLLGLPVSPVPGRDLTAARVEPRILFFHKDATPPQLGLRDGKWKFIIRQDGRGPQLYDLERDPTEQQNLARAEGVLTRRYSDRVANWYIWANHDYRDFLRDFRPGETQAVTRATIGRIRPPSLFVGRFLDDKEEEFHPMPVAGPDERLTVWALWGGLQDDINVTLRVVSPDRRVRTRDLRIFADWEISWIDLPFDPPHQAGRWEVTYWHRGRLLARRAFTVRHEAIAALRGTGGPASP